MKNISKNQNYIQNGKQKKVNRVHIHRKKNTGYPKIWKEEQNKVNIYWSFLTTEKQINSRMILHLITALSKWDLKVSRAVARKQIWLRQCALLNSLFLRMFMITIHKKENEKKNTRTISLVCQLPLLNWLCSTVAYQCKSKLQNLKENLNVFFLCF